MLALLTTGGRRTLQKNGTRGVENVHLADFQENDAPKLVQASRQFKYMGTNGYVQIYNV